MQKDHTRLRRPRLRPTDAPPMPDRPYVRETFHRLVCFVCRFIIRQDVFYPPFNLLGGIKVNHAALVTVRALTYALTHLTSARTAGVRRAMKCLVRPFTKGGQDYGISHFTKGDKVLGCKGAMLHSLASLFKGRWRGNFAASVGYMWQRSTIVPPLLKGGRADEYL